VGINRIKCPECGAGLKSSSGFTAGQSVACPKCETYFAVELPEEAETEEEEEERPAKKKTAKAVATRDDDDEDDEKPKKKKKKKSRDDDEDDERSYKNSPARFIILGVLVVVMVVLGIFLILKWQREKQDTTAKGDPPANPSGPPPGGPNPGQPRIIAPGPGGAKGPTIPPGGKGPNFPPNQGFPPPPVGGPDPLGGILGGTPAAGTAENIRLMDELGKKMIGTWEGTAPDGAVHKVTYQASGQFTHDVNGKATSGTWQPAGLVGTKVLKISRGTATLKIAFEGDELLHDTGKPGETVVLRKK